MAMPFKMNARKMLRMPSGETLLLIFLLGVFSAFCLYRIEECKIWIDEFVSISIAQRPLSMIWSMKGHPNAFYLSSTPPFYETLLHYIWNPVTGDLFLPRMFTLAAGLSVLLLIYKVTALISDKATGLAALSLALCNYGYLYYFKMIRGYALLCALCLLSIYLFLLIPLKKRRAILLIAALFVVNVAIVYTHYYGVFLFFIEGLFVFAVMPKGLRAKVFICLSLSLLSILGWQKHLLHDIYYEQRWSNFQFLPTLSLNDFLSKYLAKFRESIFLDNYLPFIYLVALACCLVWLCVVFLKKDRSRWTLLMLFCLFAIPTLAMNFFMLTCPEPARGRYFLPFLFPLFTLTALCLRTLPAKMRTIIFLVLLAFSLRAALGYLGLPGQKFWNAGLARVSCQAAEFAFPQKEKIAIEVEDYVFVPIFAYYFFGKEYFYKASIPEFGVKNLNVRDNVTVFGNGSVSASKHLLSGAAAYDKNDWLVLIYSNWLAFFWNQSFRNTYAEALAKNPSGDKLQLVHADTDSGFTVEIYKVLHAGSQAQAAN